MKKLFILFVTISLNVFSQDYKLINQKLYQYNDRKYVIEHDGFSEYGQYLMEESPYIEIATDDSLSMVISDSLTKRYGTKKQLKIIYNYTTFLILRYIYNKGNKK